MTEKAEFTPSTEHLHCPCGGSVSVGRLRQEDADSPALLHSDPPCAEFLRREVVDYMRWMNEAELHSMLQLLPEGGVEIRLPTRVLRVNFTQKSFEALKEYLRAPDIDFTVKTIVLEACFESIPITTVQA